MRPLGVRYNAAVASDPQRDGSPALEPALLTAAAMLDWRRRRGSLAALPPLSGVLITHQPGLVRALTPRWRRRSLRGLSTELRLLPGLQEVAVTAAMHVGAPAMGVLVEELAALGLRRLVAVDVAGSIDAGLASGTVLLAESAYAGDGTSPHYTPGTDIVAANEQLLQALAGSLTGAQLPFSTGRVWSTDAPFRETASQVEAARGKGAVAVDMETAALFACAGALGVEAGAVLVIADELSGGWRPPVDRRAIEATLERVARAALGCLTA